MKKGYVKYLDWLFRFSYLTLGIVSFNVFLYDSRVQPFMVKVCLVVGIFAFVGRLLFFKNYIKTPYWWVLAMFCMSFFATIVSQRQYGVAGADFKWLVWTGMLFFLLYTCDGEKKIEEYKREFTVFSYFIIGYSFLASVCSLYLMSKLYNVSWYTANGELMISGFRWGRLWGVYTDPNYGAVFSVVGILLCVYHIKIAKKWKKIPYLFIIFADYMYVIFSDSRTAEIAVTAAAAFWIVFAAVHGRKGKKAVFLSILAAIIFSAAFLVGTSYVKEEYNKEIQILQKRQAEKLKKANNKNAQSKNIKKPVVGRKKICK